MAKGHNVVTIGDELENLARMFPHKNGVRIRSAKESVNRRARAATLWTYLESGSGAYGKHYALHETVFAKNAPQTAAWWSKYFASKVFKGWKPGGSSTQRMGVLEGAIVPGVNIKTRRQWSVRAVIGYNLHDNVGIVHSAIYKKGNKPK
jgi:hypothetical protein